MSAETAEPLAEPEDGLDTSAGQDSKLNSQQMQCVAELKHWIENEADFYGRTDEEFLLMFLFGCKFNVEKVKTNMTKYYESRRKFPKWWANRDVREEPMLLSAQLKITIALKEKKNENRPTIVISTCHRMERSCDFDRYAKFHTIIMETVLRRRNCQTNGVVYIVDAKDYPSWFITKLSPFFIRDLLTNYMSMALRMESFHMLNSPPVSMGIWPLAKVFVGRKLRDRVFFHGSNWDELFNHVSIEDVPEEYGGQGGPLAPHEDAFTEEVLALNDNIVDDNKYGYVQSKHHK